MSFPDLEEIIANSVEDSEMPLDAPELETSPEQVEVSNDAPEASNEPTEALEASTEDSPEVQSPSAKSQDTTEKDLLEELSGIPPVSASGRPNRIPYDRVKKITENAVAKAKAEWEKSPHPKLSEVETKLQDYEGKVQTYESQLGKVKEFEQVMVNNPRQHLELLSRIPAYAEFFQAVEQAFTAAQMAQSSQADVSDEMPQPDQQLPDGSMVYSMEGLRALNDWNRAQARKETLSEVEKTYGPLAKEWETRKQQEEVELRYQKAVLSVRQQIEQARTWDKFKENEEEITKVLAANPSLSLEGAYRQVVIPKYTADRNKIREEILKELKQAPKATSVQAPAVKAVPQTSSGPRSLEDVIAEQVKQLKS